MNRVVAYLVFYGIFFLVLFGMHFYVYFRLNTFFVFQKPKLVLGFFAFLALLFPVSSLFEKFYPNGVTTLIYTFASVWMGVLFLLLCSFFFYEPIGFIFRLRTPAAGKVILATVAAISLYALVNGMMVRVKRVDIPFPKIAKPVTLAHLSDIHVGTIHNSGYLKRIVEKTNRLDPDMVMITGDFFDGLGPVNEHTVAPLTRLQARTYFVMGNHEKYEDMDKVGRILAHTGITVLRNSVDVHQGIQIVGIDYPEKEGQKDNPVLKEIFLDPARPSILLYHVPAGLSDAAAAGIDLQLSGHTHNGQIFPFNYLARLFYPKVKGLYRIGDMSLYVSPGTGTWGPPMRLGSSNEITLITLVPTAGGNASRPKVKAQMTTE